VLNGRKLNQLFITAAFSFFFTVSLRGADVWRVCELLLTAEYHVTVTVKAKEAAVYFRYIYVSLYSDF